MNTHMATATVKILQPSRSYEAGSLGLKYTYLYASSADPRPPLIFTKKVQMAKDWFKKESFHSSIPRSPLGQPV